MMDFLWNQYVYFGFYFNGYFAFSSISGYYANTKREQECRQGRRDYLTSHFAILVPQNPNFMLLRYRRLLDFEARKWQMVRSGKSLFLCQNSNNKSYLFLPELLVIAPPLADTSFTRTRQAFSQF